MTTPVSTTREPPPYLAATLVGLAVFAIYLLTLAPTTAFWDTSEYISAAYVMGIPHPPGNPLFSMLAHAFGALPIPTSYAVKINIFAALTSAASAGLWFLVADRWMREVVPLRWARILAAAAGVLVGATSWTVWNQSTVNEKVYTVSLLSTALVMWLGVHWADDEPGPHRDRWLILIAYILALSSTNHMMGVLAAPAVGIYVLWTDPAVLVKPWVLIGVVSAAIVGVSLNYLYLPIRAAHYPAINEGEPIGFFSQALSEVLNRAQYGKPSVFDRQADFVSQLSNYWQYFSWQFARDWGVGARVATALFTVLGGFGAYTLWKRDRRAAIASFVLMGTLTLALIFYLNFKYGYSIPVDPSRGQVAREVRERDYFFILSFAGFSLWVAVGFGALMRELAATLPGEGEARRWAAATPVLLLALVPTLGNHLTASRAHETMARDFAKDLLESVEPYGVLITAGDNDTFPLWYAQEVEGIRRDVTLANLSLMNTRWHLRQLHRRQTPEFDPKTAAALWRDGTWKRPTEPALRLTESQIDSLPELQRVPKNGGIRFDSLQVAFGSEVLSLSDIATIFLLRDNVGQRPIYFAWSDGSYPDETLGLSAYLVTGGLARRVYMAPVVPSDTIVISRGLGYLNLPRTRKLLWDVYHYDVAGRARPRGWVDKPSSSILQLYAVVYGATAATLRARGDTAAAARADSVAQTVQANLGPR